MKNDQINVTTLEVENARAVVANAKEVLAAFEAHLNHCAARGMTDNEMWGYLQVFGEQVELVAQAVKGEAAKAKLKMVVVQTIAAQNKKSLC